MSITISVSERMEQKIRRRAAKVGRNANELVGRLVEEVWDERFPDNESDGGGKKFENPFTPFIAMGASGKTDTSERMREILNSDNLDSAQGFGTDK